MDPGHVAAAGEQAGHRYYHLTVTDDATALEEGGSGGWTRALLRRGWELAGKVAVVGAAPVVAPPIMLVSAAGLALSVPFAAYLATLAATDRLMAALLPPFPAQPPHESGRDVVEQEFLDAFYHCSTTHEGVIREEDEGVKLASLQSAVPKVSFQESFVSRNGDEIEDGAAESTKETVSLATEVSEFLVPVLGGLVETREEDVVAIQQLGQDHTHALDREDKTEESTSSNVSATPVPIFTDKDNVIKGEVQGVVVEVASDLVAGMSEELVGTSYDGDVQETAAMDDTVRDLSEANIEDTQRHDQGVVCTSVSAASPLAVRDYEDVMSSGSTQDIPEICDETSQPHQESGLGYPSMKEGFDTKVISGDKDLYTEEQVRQQLETLRTVTGYRSPFSSTLAGELAGLYLFVGVEPPVSSRDASDLMEINAKLQLLKLIVGLD